MFFTVFYDNFRDVMKLLLPKLGDRQRQRISNTLLAKWLEMLKSAIFITRVDFILKRFDAVNFSFCYGSNLNVSFTAAELVLNCFRVASSRGTCGHESESEVRFP